jgi:hypothetical protein
LPDLVPSEAAEAVKRFGVVVMKLVRQALSG